MDYKKACAAYIRSASKRPGMYFRELKDFESQLHGHAVAYQELGQISDIRAAGFNSNFKDWLYDQYGYSCSSGWAYAIEDAVETPDDAGPRFFELVEPFLEQW